VSRADDRIDRLERQVEMLLATIKAQAVEIADLKRRLGENSSNSNKPPSADSPSDRRDRPKDAPSGKAPGGQPGHKGKRRQLLPDKFVTGTKDCFPDACRRCGEDLPQRRDPEPVRHQVIDVPEIKPLVDEFRLHRVTCRCGAITCGTLPDGTPTGMLGPRLVSLIALLVGEMHVSRRKVQTLLRDLLGIRIAVGTVSESEEIVSDAVAAAVDEARLHALSERVKHVDATAWYQAGAYRSLWTLATTAVTVFCIATDGSRATLRQWLSRVRGVLVTDRGTQFGFWAMERRQICWAHLVRKFASYATRRGRAGEVGDLLLLWSRVLLHKWHRVRDGTISRVEFRESAQRLRVVIERLLEQGTGLPAIAGSCEDVLAHRDAMWRFVEERGVEPTNNHAERELRGFVLWRRTTQGSRSDRGDRFAAHIKSVVHTCRKQDRHVLDYLTQSVQAALRGRRTPSLLASTP
jgi:transposase